MRDTAESRSQLNSLPRPIRARLLAVFERLVRWPNVSGAKPLRGSLKGPTGFGRVIGECCSPWMNRPSASSFFASPTGGTFTTIEVFHDYGNYHTQRPAICAGSC